jgi:hypothetical protein
MAERDTPQPETAEQLSQQLIEFVDKAEFGTVQFRAVSDYFDLQGLYSLQKTYVEFLEGDAGTKIDRESRLRIQEMKIALLEHQIEQNKSQLSGYSGAYYHMENALGEIDGLARIEAEKKHTDIKEQNLYVGRIREGAYFKARAIVSMKKDTS